MGHRMVVNGVEYCLVDSGDFVPAHVPADMTGYATTLATGSAKEDGGLRISDLLEAKRKLAEMGPFLLGIWFVERPGDYEVFTSRFPTSVAPGARVGLGCIPVRSIRWGIAETLRGLDTLPWCSFFPGIWLEMSDNLHRQVEASVLVDAFAAMAVEG